MVACKVIKPFHWVQHNQVKSRSWKWSGPWSTLRLVTHCQIFPASGNWIENLNVCRVSSPKFPRVWQLVIKLHQTTTWSALSQYLPVHSSALSWQISNMTNIYIHSLLLGNQTPMFQHSLASFKVASRSWTLGIPPPFSGSTLPSWPSESWPSDQASPLPASSAETNVQQ